MISCVVIFEGRVMGVVDDATMRGCSDPE